MEINERFCDVFQEICKKQDLKQSEIEGKTGIRQSTISTWLNCKVKPSREKIVQLQIGLQLSQADTNRLLLAAGYGLSNTGSIDSKALGHLVLALQDAGIPQDIRAKLEEDILVLVDSWRTYAEAQEYNHRRKWNDTVKKSEAASQKIKSMERRLSAYVNDVKGTAHLHKGEVAEAEMIQNGNITLVKELNDLHLQANNEIHRGDVFREQGKLDEAEKQYRQARNTLGRIGNEVLSARVRRKLAVLALYRGRWRQALVELEGCLGTFKAHQKSYEEAKTYFALGWGCNLGGQWEKAYEYHLEGLKLAQAHRISDTYPDPYLLMLGHSALGNDYRQKKEWTQAEYHYRQALQCFNDLDDKKDLGWIQMGLARIYYGKGKEHFEKNEVEEGTQAYRLADEYFKKAIKSNTQISFEYRQAMTLTHYSQFCIDARQDYDTAKSHLYQAKSHAQHVQSAYYLAEINVFLCDWYRHKKKFGEITPLAREVEDLHTECTYPHLMARLKAIQGDTALNQCQTKDSQYSYAVGLYANAFVYAVESNNERIVAEIKQRFGSGAKSLMDKRAFGYKGRRQLIADVTERTRELLDTHTDMHNPKWNELTKNLLEDLTTGSGLV